MSVDAESREFCPLGRLGAGPAVSVWFCILALPLGFGLTVMVLHYIRRVDGPIVMMDVNAIPWRPAYYGLGSLLGYLLWGASVSIGAFAGSALWGIGRRRASMLLFAVASSSLLVLVDDMLMLHERLPRALELAIYLSYGLICIAILLAARRILLAHEPILLAAALGALASAVVVDLLFPFELRWSVIVEDTLKLCGQSLWLAYFARLAYRELRLAAGELGQTPHVGV